MFTACPHCQHLLVRDLRTSALPAACPHCGKPLSISTAARDAAAGTVPSLATYLHAPAVAPDDASTSKQDDAGEAPREAVSRNAHGENEADMAHVFSIEDQAQAPMGNTVADAAAVTASTSSITTTAAADDEDKAEARREHEKETLFDAPAPVASAMASADIATVETADAPSAAASARDAMPNTGGEPTSDKPAQPTATAPIAPIATGPRFVQRPAPVPVQARTRRRQGVAVATLLLVLVVQVLVADRDRLALQAGWRPVVSALCGVLGCELPSWREPQAFAMLGRDVRPLQGAPGVLLAQATFRNDARWAQAWPVILLTLKDADGRTLGARALQPSDYLPRDETSQAIAPGQSAQIAVRVREPSANVVAFSFDFR